MAFLICAVAVCPVRAEGSHRSEQTTQLLFGEVCELLERTKDFVRVRILYDDYEGWCQTAQLEELPESFTPMADARLAGEWVSQVAINNAIVHVPFGSTLSYLPNFWPTAQNLGAIVEPAKNVKGDALVKQLAYTFLNTPYLWGGRSVFGIDCSGFTQLVFKCLNIKLQRDAYQQATQGEAVGFLQEVQCGDLAFFDNEQGRITHVGIMLDSATIIHASGKVRVDKMDNFGIVNADTGKRTHNLRIIKRMV